ncbi:cation:proton antiporter domain-containing protein [Sphingomonas quercus]|uniref:Cation:proton antiporter n=1 Tax=Sphingomonas quercus TaxID=2842451 RepID=A0ABS6BDJ9_9SPHN|nr:cation:proton antiporter [Sphingomonas quercus]MBU3076373.1 cation:proton antiporter [Sphingomonas quercus]
MSAPGPVTGDLLADGFILLGAGLVSVLLFRKLGLGAVLGYLVAGAAIGPQGLRLITAPESAAAVGEIGIVLLLFLVGLELNPARLWQLRRDIFGLGLLQVVLAGLALAGVIYFFTPFSSAAALALGLPLALSSTAQVLPLLRSAGRMNTPFGERAFSVLLFQDLSIVPLITVIAALSRAPADPAAPPGWLMAVYTVAAVAGLVLAGRFVISPIFRLIGRLGEREMFVTAGLVTVLASAALMETLHLSTALGAFVAGVMLADSPYRHELEADVEPFRSILLGLFFLSVGMMLDLHTVAMRPAFVFGMAAVLIIVKTAVLFGLCRLFGMANRPALAMGLLLSQGGEFGFVLFTQAQEALLILPGAASLFGAIVTLSMATTPFLMTLSRRFGGEAAGARLIHVPGPEEAEQSSAIIVGYGRFGQTVAQMLLAQGVSITVVDTDVEMIETAAGFGMKVWYGDGTRIDLLRQAGAEEAELIAFCIDGEGLGGAQLEPIAAAFPDARLLVRVFDRRHMLRIAGVPIAGCVREVFESAVAMGKQALTLVGADADEVVTAEADYRRRDDERFALQREHNDVAAARDMILTEPEFRRPRGT